MKAAGILLAVSLGLLISGILVAAIKPRVSVDESRTVYRVPGEQALVLLVSPSASSSRVVVDVEAPSSARVTVASVSLELLARGAAAALAGMLQSVGTSAVILDYRLVEEMLGSRSTRILSEGGPGRYVVEGVDRPVVLVVYAGQGGGDVGIHVLRYNMLVSVMDEKKLGVASSATALAALILLLGRRS